MDARAGALLLAIVLSAGCGAPTAPPDAGTEPGGTAATGGAGPVVSGTASLAGRVTGPDLAPLEGALVELLPAGPNASTDAAGRYELHGLPEGDHLVRASLPGHASVTQRAPLAASAGYTLNFQLPETPSAVPYHETQEFHGLLSCQYAYALNSGGAREADCGLPDPNQQDRRVFRHGPQTAQIQVETFWDAGTPLARILTTRAFRAVPGSDAYSMGGVTDESGERMEIPARLLGPQASTGGEVLVVVSASVSVTGDESSTDAGLAFQQTFTVYFTTFYVEAGPHDFSATA